VLENASCKTLLDVIGDDLMEEHLRLITMLNKCGTSTLGRGIVCQQQFGDFVWYMIV